MSGKMRDDERISSRFLYLPGLKLPIVSEEYKVKRNLIMSEIIIIRLFLVVVG